MRINFARPDYTKDARRQMLRALYDELADQYDLEASRLAGWAKTKNGMEHFITWLKDQGYDVKFYSWPPDDKDPVSYGLEFADDNPMLIALKMRYLDDGATR
jgi:hypothetical protein